jgi:hypothetical protein
MNLILIFVAGFLSVFALGFQSRNVNHGNYGWAAGTSFLIGLSQANLWGALLKDLSWLPQLVYAFAGCLGITSSMYVHRRWIVKAPATPSDQRETQKMKRPKILVLGHGRHGKDTVAELLQQHYGLSFESSSMFAGKQIMFEHFNRSPDLPSYESFEECYADRVNHRGEWHRQISDYNRPDKARLCREILEESDMYVGMRCSKEYEASKHLFDHVLWVDASDRGMPYEGKDSFNISYDPDEMLWISNNGDLDDLERVLNTVMSCRGIAAAL